MNPNQEKKKTRPYRLRGFRPGIERAFRLTGLTSGALQRIVGSNMMYVYTVYTVEKADNTRSNGTCDVMLHRTTICKRITVERADRVTYKTSQYRNVKYRVGFRFGDRLCPAANPSISPLIFERTGTRPKANPRTILTVIIG